MPRQPALVRARRHFVASRAGADAFTARDLRLVFGPAPFPATVTVTVTASERAHALDGQARAAGRQLARHWRAFSVPCHR
jgi:hypothetical protein